MAEGGTREREAGCEVRISSKPPRVLRGRRGCGTRTDRQHGVLAQPGVRQRVDPSGGVHRGASDGRGVAALRAAELLGQIQAGVDDAGDNDFLTPDKMGDGDAPAERYRPKAGEQIVMGRAAIRKVSEFLAFCPYPRNVAQRGVLIRAVGDPFVDGIEIGVG